jgi:predicted transcriptional regulator
MEVRTALRESMVAAGWSITRVASVAGLSEAAIRKFLDARTATLKSDALIALLKQLPGFAERLDLKVTSRAA